jgi:hypothetical protein
MRARSNSAWGALAAFTAPLGPADGLFGERHLADREAKVFLARCYRDETTRHVSQHVELCRLATHHKRAATCLCDRDAGIAFAAELDHLRQGEGVLRGIHAVSGAGAQYVFDLERRLGRGAECCLPTARIVRAKLEFERSQCGIAV